MRNPPPRRVAPSATLAWTFCLSLLLAPAGRPLAQTLPKGKVITAASAVGKPVLDPNGDGFVSKTTSGFVSDDVAESEIPYFPLPAYGAEPAGDTRTGASGGVTDLVDTSPTKQALMVFYSRGADGLADTADDRLLFRMRLGKNPKGAFGFSVLVDTDLRFGTTGTKADPNAIAGNPGFEVEIILATGGAKQGLSLYDVDGRTAGVLKASYAMTDSSHRALALTETSGDDDVFLDFFIPFAALNQHFGITSTTLVRFVGASSSSPGSTLGGSASDMGGVPDSDPRFADPDNAFGAAVDSFPATGFGDLGTGGVGFDTTPPDTAIASGPPALTNAITATFALTSTEALSTFECSLDGGAFATCSAAPTFSALGNGAHQLQARARDRAGNADPSPAVWNWTVDTVPPATPVVTSPASGGTVNTVTPTFRGTAEAGSTVRVSVDSVVLGTAVADASGQWTFVAVAPLSLGAHTVSARATDAAGNQGPASATQPFTVAIPRPDTTILSGPPSPTRLTSATFTFSSNVAGASFECKLDAAAFASCTSPHALAGLAEGNRTFQVRARDAYGQEDLSPAIHAWTVDTHSR